MKKIKIINLQDAVFPEKLKLIKSPPKELYAIGNIELLNKPSLAIIGTRQITQYGVKNCEYFAKEIVKRDIPIVSGMAVGTDTIAHKTALQYGGNTIAVLGSGLNHIFPQENSKLFEDIVQKNGLIITEYPPNTRPKSERFLERNRIVSGLSEGVLIIEAAYRSGTSVTAKIAKSQGKVVMALPGRLDNSYGVGVNKLIQEGAKLVTNIEDIIKNFPQFMNKVGKSYRPKQISLWDIKQEYREIVEILQKDTLSIEEIVQKTKQKELRKTLNLLINMELEGVIIQEIGVGYKLS